jgi:glutamate-ammonia-ligase adenylyltransferase
MPALRGGTTLEALAALGGARLLPEDAVAELSESYAWLRRAEHALQLVEERQTHRFPRDAVAQLALARRLGLREPDAERARARLLEDWARVRARVRAHFEALVLEDADA